MDALECIKTRMSIRKFKPEALPEALLRQVLETASWSPSYKNSQPWEVMVLSGEKKEGLTRLLLDLQARAAAATPDLATPTSWPPAEEARIAHLFSKRRAATGIDLADPKVVVKTKQANFAFYGAPHAIYLYQDASLSQWSLFDLGLFAQSLMLAARALGVGTVPQAFATDYAAETKEYLGIPAGKRLVLGLSVGYPDMESPTNALRTDRSPIEDFVTWR